MRIVCISRASRNCEVQPLKASSPSKRAVYSRKQQPCNYVSKYFLVFLLSLLNSIQNLPMASYGFEKRPDSNLFLFIYKLYTIMCWKNYKIMFSVRFFLCS